VVGGAEFLVAYERSTLNTSDISVCQQIAKAIRFSTGGLSLCSKQGRRAEGLGICSGVYY